MKIAGTEPLVQIPTRQPRVLGCVRETSNDGVLYTSWILSLITVIEIKAQYGIIDCVGISLSILIYMINGVNKHHTRQNS